MTALAADDPRHGTLAGHASGCRCERCNTAKLRYDKLSRYEREHGIDRTVDATGFRRRVRALQAIGWPLSAIAERLGIPRTCLGGKLSRGTRVTIRTHHRMAAVYQNLAEMAGPEIRSIRAAERNGWPRPIQWDEGESGPHAIDDPDSAPWQPPIRRKDSIVDESVVWLAMAGQKVHATKAERLEIIRRWTTAGRSLNQLNRTQGWNCDRDIREAA